MYHIHECKVKMLMFCLKKEHELSWCWSAASVFWLSCSALLSLCVFHCPPNSPKTWFELWHECSSLLQCHRGGGKNQMIQNSIYMKQPWGEMKQLMVLVELKWNPLYSFISLPSLSFLILWSQGFYCETIIESSLTPRKDIYLLPLWFPLLPSSTSLLSSKHRKSINPASTL